MTRPWRLSRALEPGDGPANMALDAALLESVGDGAAPVLRLYRWDPATLSFGRNQPAAGLYDAEAARARGIAFVRRPTGGQAVLHADELTYAVVAPVAAIGRPREAYRRINEGLVAGLRRLGVEAEVAEAGAGSPVNGPAGTDWSAACFRDPAEGEVVVRGRKLVGSAQRCEGRVILQHGSILVSGSQAAAEELLIGPAAGRTGPTPDPADRVRGGSAVHAPRAGWTTLADELGGRPSRDRLAAAIVAGFEAILGTALAPGRLSVEESARAGTLRARFESAEWTWRR